MPVSRDAVLGEAEEVANVVTFLASPLSSYVNGAVYEVGGGVQAMLSQG